MNARGETIAAVATPPGRGAISIVRISGPAAGDVATAVLRTRSPLRARHATNAEIVDASGALVDRGIAIFWCAPHSYTGEDVLELHVHGSPVVVRRALESALTAGARLAEPGEFTRRAYANGKMDLSEANAVADLIAAETRAAAAAALANLGGALAAEVRQSRDALEARLEELAGAIDFPDEVPDPPPAQLDAAITEVFERLRALRDDGERGRLFREGTSVAIVGPPNAGKSSLLNALLGQERALVSELPGTTRDTIEESIVVDGVPVRLVDTAGLRAHADRLEAAGIERTRRAIDEARIALVTLDGSRALGDAERDVLRITERRDRIVFFNKSDAGVAAYDEITALDAISGSVYEAATLAALRTAIARVGWGGEQFDFSRPHLAAAFEIDAVTEALEALAHARATLAAGDPVDLCSGDLQRAVAALGHVSGERATEALLDGIFARFCIGK